VMLGNPLCVLLQLKNGLKIQLFLVIGTDSGLGQTRRKKPGVSQLVQVRSVQPFPN